MKDLENIDKLLNYSYEVPKQICYSCKFVKAELFYNYCTQDKNKILMLEEAANSNFIDDECPYYKMNFITKIKKKLKK